MSHPNDDMVLRPDVKGKGAKGTAQKAAAEKSERRDPPAAKKRRNLLQRAATARFLKNRAAQAGRMLAKGTGAAEAAGGAGQLVAKVMKGAAWAAAAAYVARTYSERSFEAQAAIVNEIVLGDADDKARASEKARAMMLGDPFSWRFGAGGGNVAYYNALYERFFREERVKSKILTDLEGGGRFDVQGKADVAIQRFNRALEEILIAAWEAIDGEGMVRAVEYWVRSQLPAGGWR